MMLHEPANSLDRVKEVKVKIPVGHHIRLHSMKLLSGKPISDTVAEALEIYFREHPAIRGELPSLESVDSEATG